MVFPVASALEGGFSLRLRSRFYSPIEARVKISKLCPTEWRENPLPLTKNLSTVREVGVELCKA